MQKKFRVKVYYGVRPMVIRKVKYYYLNSRRELAELLYRLYKRRKKENILRIEVSKRVIYGFGYQAPFAVYPHGWDRMWRFYAIIVNELGVNPLEGESKVNIHYYICANPWIPLEKRKKICEEAGAWEVPR